MVQKQYKIAGSANLLIARLTIHTRMLEDEDAVKIEMLGQDYRKKLYLSKLLMSLCGFQCY